VEAAPRNLRGQGEDLQEDRDTPHKIREAKKIRGIDGLPHRRAARGNISRFIFLLAHIPLRPDVHAEVCCTSDSKDGGSPDE